MHCKNVFTILIIACIVNKWTKEIDRKRKVLVKTYATSGRF